MAVAVAPTPLAEQREVDRALELFTDFEQERRPHEEAWAQIAEYVLPRREFELRYGTPSIRKRRLIDTTAVNANERFAALIFGSTVTPSAFIKPYLPGHTETVRERRWLDGVRQHMHEHFRSPRSNFVLAFHETAQDEGAFGNSVMWIGRKPGQRRSVHMPMRLHECYWRENAYGVVDQLVRRFKLKLHVAAQRFPTPKLKARMDRKNPHPNEMIEFLHWVSPREGGVYGSIATRKPFSDKVYCIDTKEIAEEGGYNTFPYAVTRLNKRPGESYGEGPGLNVLPIVRALNELEETILRAAELATDPPLVSRIGHIGRLQRRAGAVNNLSSSQTRALEGNGRAFEALHEPGNSTVSIEIVRDFRHQINAMYYIDWMSMGAEQVLSATEVNYRRGQIMRAMGPIVARQEAEKLTPVAERNYDLHQSLFAIPPSSMDGLEFGWQFDSPLAQAQQAGDLEMLDRALGIIERVQPYNDNVQDVADLDGLVEDGLVSAGMPATRLRSPEARQAIRDQRAAREEEARQVELAQGAAQAVRDGGQGVQTLQGANVL